MTALPRRQPAMPSDVPHPPPGTICCVGPDSRPYLLSLARVVKRIGVKRPIPYRNVKFPGLTPRLEFLQTEDGRLHHVLPPGCYAQERLLSWELFEVFYEIAPDEVVIAGE